MCYEPLCGHVASPLSVVTDNSLCCPAGHKVCTACLWGLVRPNEHESSGFSYCCPLCREESGLTRLHVLVLLRGTWGRAAEKFGSDAHRREWNAGVQGVA